MKFFTREFFHSHKILNGESSSFFLLILISLWNLSFSPLRRKFMILFFSEMKNAFYYRSCWCNFHFFIFFFFQHLNVWNEDCFMFYVTGIHNFTRLITMVQKGKRHEPAVSLTILTGLDEFSCFLNSWRRKLVKHWNLWLGVHLMMAQTRHTQWKFSHQAVDRKFQFRFNGRL